MTGSRPVVRRGSIQLNSVPFGRISTGLGGISFRIVRPVDLEKKGNEMEFQHQAIDDSPPSGRPSIYQFTDRIGESDESSAHVDMWYGSR